MTSVKVDPVDVLERPVDSKGRVSLGTDYAGETVRAAVLDVVSDGQDGERDPVTVCIDCDAVWAGRTSHCSECGSEAVRQETPRDNGSD